MNRIQVKTKIQIGEEELCGNLSFKNQETDRGILDLPIDCAKVAEMKLLHGLTSKLKETGATNTITGMLRNRAKKIKDTKIGWVFTILNPLVHLIPWKHFSWFDERRSIQSEWNEIKKDCEKIGAPKIQEEEIVEEVEEKQLSAEETKMRQSIEEALNDKKTDLFDTNLTKYIKFLLLGDPDKNDLSDDQNINIAAYVFSVSDTFQKEGAENGFELLEACLPDWKEDFSLQEPMQEPQDSCEDDPSKTTCSDLVETIEHRRASSQERKKAVPSPKKSSSALNALEEKRKQIKKIKDSKQKESSYLELAREYHALGNIEKALELAEKVYMNTKDKEALYIKMARDAYKKGDSEKALELAEKVYMNTKDKEAFYIEMARDALEKGDAEKALELAEKVYMNTKDKENFYSSVAHDYVQKDNYIQALKVINLAYLNPELKNDILIQIISKTSSNPSLCTYYLKSYLNNQLSLLINLSYYPNTPPKTTKETRKKIALFFHDLAEVCYEKVSKEGVNIGFSFINEHLKGAWLKCVISLLNGEKPELKPSQKNKKSRNNDLRAGYCRDLGLEPEASIPSIKKAYKKQALHCHPDRIKQQKNENDQAYKARVAQARTQFEKIQAAHEYLTDRDNK